MAATAARFAADARVLWLLRVDSGLAQTTGRGGRFGWTPGMPEFPHLYALEEGEWADIGRENVVDMREVAREEGQGWVEAMEAQLEGWLVDE